MVAGLRGEAMRIIIDVEDCKGCPRFSREKKCLEDGQECKEDTVEIEMYCPFTVRFLPCELRPCPLEVKK